MLAKTPTLIGQVPGVVTEGNPVVDIWIDGAGSSVGSASGATSTDEEFVVGGGTNK